jgi:hypothetical protein
MNYQEVAKRIWRHTEVELSDKVAQMKEIVRYTTLAPSGHNAQP